MGQQGSPSLKRLKVFIDCKTGCDYSFIRTEIDVVDFLLDRVAADVHVLYTSRTTGSGGRNGQLIFYGQNRFKGSIDSLAFFTLPNATDFEIREQLVKYIQVGLLPFIARNGSLADIQVSTRSTVGRADQNSSDEEDPWNFWVFRFGGNGNLRVDKVYKQHRFNGHVNASHTTDNVKARFHVSAGRDIAEYTYTDSTSTTVTRIQNEEYNAWHLLVKSLSPHWSYGYETSFSNNTFTNIRSRFYFSPSLEYSFFPYQMVNNKFLTFRIGPELRDNHYYDTTLFNKTDELLWGQKTELSLALNQKWGSINANLRYRNYFHDVRFYNVSLTAGVDIRITGGLTFNVDLHGALVHDQINLKKGGATKEEVLTRVRQLGSSYNFTSWFGLNYRFGSKYNNFVNPRFD